MIIPISTGLLLSVLGIVLPLAGKIIATVIVESARWHRWQAIWNGKPSRGFLFEPRLSAVLKSITTKQFRFQKLYIITVALFLIAIRFLVFGKNFFLKPADCSFQLITGPALCMQDGLVHGDPTSYIASAAKAVLAGNYDRGEFSWVVGNNEKWLNRNPAGDHPQPLKFASCNSTLTLSDPRSNTTAYRRRGDGSYADMGNFAQYSFVLPNGFIDIPSPTGNQTIGGYSRSPLVLTPGGVSFRPSENNGRVLSTLGPVMIWYDIGQDGGRCNITGLCVYIYRQSRLAFSEEAQAIMGNRTREGEDTTGVLLTGTFTTHTFECSSIYADEWLRAGNFSQPFFIPTMTPHIHVVVTVLGALHNGRNLPSDLDNFQSSIEFDQRVAKTIMLMDLMTYSSQCNTKYYVWGQCTEAPFWLVLLIVPVLVISIAFAFVLGIFYYLRPRSTEIGTKKGKYASSRYPVSSWQWYKEWCRQSQQLTTNARYADAENQRWLYMSTLTSAMATSDDFTLCITQQESSQAIRFTARHNAVARDPTYRQALS